ncbi:cytochrome P450 [Rhizophagus clarus]|nr:cytochrome P450 [Rhizophagus clarus]
MNEMGIYFNHEYSSWKFNKNVLLKSVTLPKFLKEIVIELQEQFKELENYWNDIEPVKSDSVKSNLQIGSSTSSTKKNNNNINNNIMRHDDKIIDISKWINCFTLDIFLQSITREKSFSMANYFNQIMKDDEENKLKGIEPILDKNNLFISRFKNSLWLLNQFNFKLIGLPQFFKKFFIVYKLYYRKYFDDYWWFHESLLTIVRTRRLEISNSPQEKDLKADMLTCLINYGLKNDDGRATTDEEIVFMMKEYLSEGIDTISNTFCYIVYYICKYPTIKYRMIEEIDSLYNNQNDTFTYFILAKLYYCEAVIKEVLRIHSVQPLISRILNEKENIGGYTWDNGQMFCINLHAIHNHESNWNNPEDFDPERFLYLEEKKAEEKELNEKDYIGNPFMRKDPLFTFGLGLRSCPAQNLSMIILKTMVVMFLRKYDVILMDKNLELQVNYYNMLNNCEELKVKIRPRHNNVNH